jgi:hypothetical protein
MSAETIEQFAARVQLTGRDVIEALCTATGDISAWHTCEPRVRAKYEHAAMILNAIVGAPAQATVVGEAAERLRHAALWTNPDDTISIGGVCTQAKCADIRAVLDAAVPASRPALDVEKAAREIVADIWQDATSARDAENRTAALLRRHATDTGITNLTSASSSSVVTDTADGIQAIPVSTDTGWVQVPTTQTAGELVVPEDGIYVRRMMHTDAVSLDATVYKSGMKVGDATAAIRRIDTDAPTTWIERSTTTTRAWTVDTIPAPDTPFWYFGAACPKRGTGAVLNHANDAARLEFFADEEITAWCYITLPQDGPR